MEGKKGENVSNLLAYNTDLRKKASENILGKGEFVFFFFLSIKDKINYLNHIQFFIYIWLQFGRIQFFYVVKA